MAVMTKKRSVMTLYSGSLDINSHSVRIVLAEKGILANIIEIDRHDNVPDLSELNPYNSVPTLVDRDLVLYNAPIIMEYLDERFPHPPLLPVYPVARARFRLMMYRVDRDWYSLVKLIQNGDADTAKQARKELKEALISVIPVFSEMPYFLSDEFSLVDCCIAPLLWRLSLFGVELPSSAKPILQYADRVFERDSFQTSLTEAERELQMVG